VDCRELLGAFALILVAAPIAAEAQQAGRVYRVGILRATASLRMDPGTEPTLTNTLRELGYVEGQNLTVEGRYADGKLERLPVLARELVQLRADVIVAIGSSAIRAAKEATTTLPFVMYGGFDPVAAGFVASLARPGGNVTGFVGGPGSSLTGKWLELLKEAVPRAARVAFLVPDDPNFRPQAEEAQQGAPSLGIKLVVVEVRVGDHVHAFSTMSAERAAALLVGATPYFRLMSYGAT
jgi:putative tryptophan/tyrosine transport system substrate-binding protein